MSTTMMTMNGSDTEKMTVLKMPLSIAQWLKLVGDIIEIDAFGERHSGTLTLVENNKGRVRLRNVHQGQKFIAAEERVDLDAITEVKLIGPDPKLKESLQAQLVERLAKDKIQSAEPLREYTVQFTNEVGELTREKVFINPDDTPEENEWCVEFDNGDLRYNNEMYWVTSMELLERFSIQISESSSSKNPIGVSLFGDRINRFGKIVLIAISGEFGTVGFPISSTATEYDFHANLQVCKFFLESEQILKVGHDWPAMCDALRPLGIKPVNLYSTQLTEVSIYHGSRNAIPKRLPALDQLISRYFDLKLEIIHNDSSLRILPFNVRASNLVRKSTMLLCPLRIAQLVEQNRLADFALTSMTETLTSAEDLDHDEALKSVTTHFASFFKDLGYKTHTNARAPHRVAVYHNVPYSMIVDYRQRYEEYKRRTESAQTRVKKVNEQVGQTAHGIKYGHEHESIAELYKAVQVVVGERVNLTRRGGGIDLDEQSTNGPEIKLDNRFAPAGSHTKSKIDAKHAVDSLSKSKGHRRKTKIVI